MMGVVHIREAELLFPDIQKAIRQCETISQFE